MVNGLIGFQTRSYAKNFVVFILSGFAGAAEKTSEALIVYLHVEVVAGCIKEALVFCKVRGG